jgi:hypothetical protein
MAVLISAGARAKVFTNAPGQVVVVPHPVEERIQLSGHFDIRPQLGNEPAIESTLGGGACLVAQLPDAVGGTCTSEIQCADPATGGRGYCIKETPTAANGTCWVRAPETDFNDACKIPVTGPGSFDTPAFDVTDFVRDTRARRWRVYACLNGPPGACSKPADYVEGLTVLHRAGPITYVRIPRLPGVKDYARGWGPLPPRLPIALVIAWLTFLLGRTLVRGTATAEGTGPTRIGKPLAYWGIVAAHVAAILILGYTIAP